MRLNKPSPSPLLSKGEATKYFGYRHHRKTRAFAGLASLLAEGEIRFYAGYVGGIHKRCLTKPAFALCSFRGQQMTSRRVRSQDLAARRDFKTLRY